MRGIVPAVPGVGHRRCTTPSAAWRVVIFRASSSIDACTPTARWGAIGRGAPFPGAHRAGSVLGDWLGPGLEAGASPVMAVLTES